MTRGLSSAITTELGNQNIKPIALVELNFPTPQRITNHYKDLTHNSNTYTASSHLLGISGKGENSSIDVSNFQIELSAVDSAFVSIVLNNVVNNDQVTVDMGFLDSTDALIDTFTYEIGLIDSFRIDTEKGILILNCTSHFADFSRTAGRKTNNGSQQRFFSTDVGFEFAGLTVQDILWGRK
jgi:hypothetical protein